ncbi:MAG: YeeE/YedE family protein [Leptospiraceae bacterium]|nr:YeeE/YedE family protein [Leptospiraceae bacterium]
MSTEETITIEENRKPKPYWSPYLAGFGLGLVLLGSLLLMGRGLGASGAMTRTTGLIMHSIIPEHTMSLDYMRAYINDENGIMNEYLVFLLAGVFVGGFVSGALDNRIKIQIDKGPTASNKLRLSLAILGGMISGFGARLSRGCTSGQALTGGGTLAFGSWLFLIGAFAAGYSIAYFVRRQWQ